MATLSAYLSAVRRLLNDVNQTLYTTADLTAYVNEARRQVAAEGQCIRRLTPAQGSLTAITVTSQGTGYGAVDVVIGGPDFPSGAGNWPNGRQASAVATTGAGGTITAVTVLSTGDGYFAPAISFSGAGSGATATAVVSGIAQTVAGQEAYPFSYVNALVSGNGISTVIAVNGVSVVWGALRYTLQHWGFQKYQAYARNYAVGYQSVPAVFAQLQQGSDGSLYMFPVANEAYPMEWDVVCLPIELAADSDVDAVPPIWFDAVKFYAAYLAFTGRQRFADADRMWNEYVKFMRRARQFSTPGGVTNWYGA